MSKTKMNDTEFHEVTIVFRADKVGLKEFINYIEAKSEEFRSSALYEYIALMHTFHEGEINE